MQNGNVTLKCCVSRNDSHTYSFLAVIADMFTSHRSEFKPPGLKETPSSSEMNVGTALSIRILLFSFHKSTENRIRGQLSCGDESQLALSFISVLCAGSLDCSQALSIGAIKSAESAMYRARYGDMKGHREETGEYTLPSVI